MINKDYIINNSFIEDVEYFQNIDSTNTYLKNISNKYFKDNRLVIADSQSAGRGRMTKSFHSPTDGLYFSFVIKPKLRIEEIQLITIITALAVNNSIKTLYNIESNIKWLNDIYIDNKKVSGILAEGSISNSDHYDYIVIGIGINLKKSDNIPDSIKDIYTALDIHSNKIVDKNILIVNIMNEFERLSLSAKSDIIESYKDSCLSIMKKVFYKNKEYIVKDISDLGHIIIEDDERNLLTLNSGEVSLVYED